MFNLLLISSFLALSVTSLAGLSTIAQKLTPEVDYLDIKLSVDSLVDPSIDQKSVKSQIQKMQSDIQAMLPGRVTSMQKILTIRKYLYDPGPWNDYKGFEYDQTDPMGTNIQSKLLANYLRTKKGNCVSMPILVLILADKLGLNVSLAAAPLHLLVKFTEDETGREFNLEATSGGYFSRTEWYKKQRPMTQTALDNGVYLEKLTRTQSAAAMLILAGEYLLDVNAHQDAVDTFETGLDQYPKSVYSMVKAGSGYYRMLESQFLSKYRKLSQIPVEQRQTFHKYVQINKQYFQQAERIGWREPTTERN